MIQHRGKQKNIEIVREITKDLPKVLVDRIKIEQVFVNTFINAIQSMLHVGKFFIRSSLIQLERSGNGIGRRNEDFFRPGQKVITVRIEDTGEGIPPENLAKIFDPFFSTKKPGEGTGLGLAVVKSIMDMHRGCIEVKSQINKGTEFTFTFNMAEGVHYGEKKDHGC